jgi:hypothetical protein
MGETGMSGKGFAALALTAFCFLGCSRGGGERLAVPEPQLSPWGEARRGLALRVAAPTRIEQNLRLPVTVELRCAPEKLPAGARQLNTFLPDEYLTLRMTRLKTKEQFTVRPYDPTWGMPADDDGKATEPLDGRDLKPWKTEFPLLAAKPPPGDYECRVEFSAPEGKGRWWRGTDAQRAAAGFWSGTVTSAPFTLVVLRETPKTRVFQVPFRLRLAKGAIGPEITFIEEDTEKVRRPVRNGFYIGGQVNEHSRRGLLSEIASPLPNPVDQLYDYQGGDLSCTYTLEIFETADRPEHMWLPSPGSGDYKILWKKEFRVRFSEAELKACSPARPEPAKAEAAKP